MPPRRASLPLLALLPLAGGGCHKLSPDQPTIQTVTLMGTAVAPADQVSDLLPATPAIHLARRAGQGNVPLAYARVQALDASLHPIPGVAEVRTDAGGRYIMTVPADHPYVLRFSVEQDDRRVDLLTLAQARSDVGAQVVNADAASHVATQVILGKAGGLDAALEAIGAPELQTLVEAIRRGLTGKVPLLASRDAVAEIVATEAADAALSPVLERVERAAAEASAYRPPPMLTSRVVAAAGEATADVIAAPIPSPSPSPTPSPAPQAYRTEPQAETAAEPEVRPRPAPRHDGVHPVRRVTLPGGDPFWAARERAQVSIDKFFSVGGRHLDARGIDPPQSAVQVRSDPVWQAQSGGAQEVTKPGAVLVRKGLPRLELARAASFRGAAHSPAGGSGPHAKAGRSIRLAGSLAAGGQSAIRRHEFAHSAGSAPPSHALPGSARGSVRPEAIQPGRSRGPIALVLDYLARWLPRFRPPTSARTT